MTCQFCGSPAEYRCSVKTERYLRVPVGKLQIGDHVCRNYEDRPKPGSHGVVDDISARPPYDRYDRETLSVTIIISRAGKPLREKTFNADPLFEMRAARQMFCGASVCENCGQDPGDDHRRCPEHWTIRTLEQAA